MSGHPVVIEQLENGFRFEQLKPITTGRDDPQSFREDLLQTLIDEVPNVLPIKDFIKSATTLYALGREIPVDIGGSAGFIDNLLVTNDGYLVIVETKLYRNPEATRAVVTQALQYGMAIGQLSLIQLESTIRRAEKSSLQKDESIFSCISRLSSEAGKIEMLADDFEENLERNLRNEEILLLIVSDGIRVGVERITHWLNGQVKKSSPFKFGLVDLGFHTIGNKRMVIPRTFLKSLEISRHVVVVNISPNSEVNVSAKIQGDFLEATGNKSTESTPVRLAAIPLNKVSLINLLKSEDQLPAQRLIEQLEIAGLESQGTGSTLKFGLMADDGQFHPVISLNKPGAWVGTLKKDADLLGDQALLEFKNAVNRFAPFFPDDRPIRLDTGYAGKYGVLDASVEGFVATISQLRDSLEDALREQMEF